MKTLKQIAFAAAVLAAPFMAQASMTSMDDSALSSVTGQDGISIAGNFGGSIGSVVYTDGDAAGGSLRMEGISFTGFNILDADPLTVDVITGTIGGVATQQLEIGLPGMVGTVSVAAMKVGATTAHSLGGLSISDINMSGTKVRVWGH